MTDKKEIEKSKKESEKLGLNVYRLCVWGTVAYSIAAWLLVRQG